MNCPWLTDDTKYSKWTQEMPHGFELVDRFPDDSDSYAYFNTRMLFLRCFVLIVSIVLLSYIHSKLIM